MVTCAKMVVFAVFVSLASFSHAQISGKVDLETAEMAAELIGAPVYAADGSEIGQVADISFDDDGEPRGLRIKTAAALGLGERTVDIPQGAFITLRGAVVLELSAEDVQALPELAEHDGEN